jgi:uncharacterized protein
VVEVELLDLYLFPGRAVAGEDDDVRFLEDDLIDLEPALRDAVVLALPFRPVCREDCPGLCQQCGAALADDPSHHHEDADPRWAALRELAVDPAAGPLDPEHDTKEN